tara:strand:- start:327 stop:803 length:477 start_codon:yes stop_codon:yes gene_type:complete
MNYIFDLDHTVIDSSHRQLTRADGTLDLDNWIANCTAEKIYQDKLLPLARLMRSAYSQGHHVIICTARVLSAHDHGFLATHNLRADYILSREMGDNRADAEMKRDLLINYFASKNIPLARWTRNAVFYDDNQAVLDMAQDLGIRAKNAIQINASMGAK